VFADLNGPRFQAFIENRAEVPVGRVFDRLRPTLTCASLRGMEDKVAKGAKAVPKKTREG
jgi:hypothetical protein